jgi:hypothetical protein
LNNNSVINNYKIELERLAGKNTGFSNVDNLGIIRFKICVHNNKIECLPNLLTILRIIDEKILLMKDFPTIDEWYKIFPPNFINKFAKEMTKEEAMNWMKNWQSLSLQEKMQEEKKRQWTFSNWIYWFEPDNRKWFLFSHTEINKKEFWLDIMITEVPTPLDALRWMLEAFNFTIQEEIEI